MKNPLSLRFTVLRPIIIPLILCFNLTAGQCQEIGRSSRLSGTIPRDTALVNRYIKITLPFAANIHTLDSAFYYLQQILSLSQNSRYPEGVAQYYRLLAVTYDTRQRPDSALWAANLEWNWAERSGNRLEMAKAYDLKAWLYHRQDEIDSAANYYIRALHIADSLQQRKFSGEIYNNLSALFFETGDNPQSEKYALKGYQAGRTINDSNLFINCLFNLANAACGQKKYDTSLLLFGQLKDIVLHSSTYSYFLPQTLINEAGVLTEMGRTGEAITAYRKVLQQPLSPYLQSYAYSGLGNALLQAHRSGEAEASMDKAIQIAEKLNARVELRENYRYMSAIKESQQQYADALIYLKKYNRLNDTLVGESTQKNIHQLEIKYKTAQKDRLLAEQYLSLSLKQRAIEKKNAWLSVFFVGMLALLAILLLSLRNHRHKRKLHEQSLITLRKDNEMNTLKAKMEAREEERNRIAREMHDDIGSGLTTILFLSNHIKQDGIDGNAAAGEKIARNARSLIGKMNEIIWSMNTDYDTLEDLLSYIRQHASELLESAGQRYHIAIPERIPAVKLSGEQRRNIYLVMKEALHNAIRHSAAGEIAIAVQFDPEIRILISDNGRGIDPTELRRFGNGLKNMQQRMESIGGRFEISGNEGTKVQLDMPLPG